jgi:transcriptional regulator with XRE-family HTH domain
MRPNDWAKDDIRGPHPFDLLVGANIRRIRISSGYSQESAGAAMGVSFQQHQKFETGSNRICASKLAILAAFFNCSILDFFEDVGDKKASQRILNSANSDMNCRVVHAFNALRPKSQAAIMNLMRTMAGADE